MVIGAVRNFLWSDFLFRSPKLIRMVGSLDHQAEPDCALYCRSAIRGNHRDHRLMVGLPVSSTIIAVGGRFWWWGFYGGGNMERPPWCAREAKRRGETHRRMRKSPPACKLVRRSHFMTIVAVMGYYRCCRGDHVRR